MVQRVVTNDEIKAILQISGVSQDALIDMWNDTAHEILTDIIGVTELAKHTVSDEKVKCFNEEYLDLAHAPVIISETITIKDENFDALTTPPASYYQPDSDFRVIYGKEADGKPFFFEKGIYHVSYTAGYTINDTVEFTDNPTDGLQIATRKQGAQTTYTFKDTPGDTETNIQIGASASETAGNFASKFAGAVTLGSTVTLPVGVAVLLSTAPTTIVNQTLPQQLKMAIAFMVNGGLNEKSKNVTSYTIGQKTINFRNSSEAESTERIVNRFISKFKRIHVFG